MRKTSISAVGLLACLLGGVVARASDFYAYHTRLDYVIPVEKGRRGISGKYADIVVNLGKEGRLVFGRRSGYLPYWKTAHGRWDVEEIVRRDGDPLCLYCYARVIENAADEILVHWRYVPDLDKVGFQGVVHESFRITPDGEVERTVRKATAKTDVWAVTTQTFRLRADGIRQGPTLPSRLHRPIAAEVKSSPVKSAAVGSPAIWLRFDDGLRPDEDVAIESISGTRCRISGQRSLWKAGVSGTALALDGYYSKVTLPATKAPAVERAVTVDAWIALGAYPWNRAPIVHHSTGSGNSGYYLGVGPYGRAVFVVDGKTVKSPQRLGLYRWTHLAGTYGDGQMAVYIDGRKVGSTAAAGETSLPDTDLLIGLNSQAARPTDPVRGPNNNLPSIFGLEGLVDEVKIYNTALSESEIAESFRKLSPGAKATDNPDLQRRILPGEVTGKPAQRFGARYAKLTYHDLWDGMWRTSDWPDLVVRFDQLPTSVVYWRGANYGPGWVTENNKWMADQSCEQGGPHGCAEHMADKQLRHGHVRLIENTPARVVVHWRYPSIDVGYEFPDPRSWADEYHTIYPDGTAVRKVHFYAGNPGWQDVQLLSQPGTTCLDNVDLQALSLANLAGEVRELRWSGSNGVPRNTLPDACIELVNFKSKYKVFVIFQEGTYINPWGDREQSEHTRDPFAGPWNHWPVSQVPSDGRFAVAHDRVTHAALAAADNVVSHGNMAIYGFTSQPISTLVPLGRYWNHPPGIGRAEGCRIEGFDKAQRAYVLGAEAPAMSFQVGATKDSPLVNPCFVIENWGSSQTGARVKIDGSVLAEGKNFRQGIVRDTDGKPILVVWIEHRATVPTRFEIEKLRELSQTGNGNSRVAAIAGSQRDAGQ